MLCCWQGRLEVPVVSTPIQVHYSSASQSGVYDFCLVWWLLVVISTTIKNAKLLYLLLSSYILDNNSFDLDFMHHSIHWSRHHVKTQTQNETVLVWFCVYCRVGNINSSPCWFFPSPFLLLNVCRIKPGKALPVKDVDINSISDLEVGQVIQGYVKNVGERGIFVRY